MKKLLIALVPLLALTPSDRAAGDQLALNANDVDHLNYILKEAEVIE